jgi:hypothetical protein
MVRAAPEKSTTLGGMSVNGNPTTQAEGKEQ